MAWLSVLPVALLLAGTGCRKQDPNAGKPAAEKALPGSPAQPAQAESPVKSEPEALPTQPAAKPVPDAPAETPPPENPATIGAPTEPTNPDGPGKEEAATEGKPPEGPVVEARPETPTPAVDRERLKAVFVDMWCAEQRGASAEELLAIYHKYDYPPLDNWHAVWHSASVDMQWTRSILEAARSNCWDTVKDKKQPAEQPAQP